MIISRTPFRLGLFGGGTDLPTYANQFGGAVLNMTINRYVYVTVHTRFEPGIRLSYSQTEIVVRPSDLKHPIVRNSLNFLDVKDSLEITSISEIPSYGSGLGSSSSFAVGLLCALNAYYGDSKDSITLAEQACHVEINLCGQSIGKQDQYAAAVGGINLFHFNPDQSVGIEKLELGSKDLEKFFSHIILFYTGQTRSASELLSIQQDNLLNDPKVLAEFHKTKEFAYLGSRFLRTLDIEGFGQLMDVAWASKKNFSESISNAVIDRNYARAKSLGAYGGKLLGAGGGGFFMYVAPPELHRKIIESQVGFQQTPIGYEPLGSQVIFDN